MARRRAKSNEGRRWPTGAAVAAAAFLVAGPLVRAACGDDPAGVGVDALFLLLLAPPAALGARRALEGGRPPASSLALAVLVVVGGAVVHLAAASGARLALEGSGGGDRFLVLLRDAARDRSGALLLAFAALALADRALGLRGRLAARDEELAAVREKAAALAARGTDVARRLKDEAERRGRFERIHRHSRLEALRARLRPGFLVGVVDRARAAAADDPQRAERMLLRLSLFLRTALREGEADLVPLSEEIERTDAILELERERLGRRLKYRFDVPEELLDDPVPALLLAPLVLRAVAAGPGASKRGGRIDVGASAEDGRLVLEIQDDVSVVVSADEARKDPELVALGERLRILYGTGARIRSGARTEGGTRLVVELPRAAGVQREAG
ncbi:MAG: histidine kinase [Planctomycetota bacterium JB042]